MGTKLMVVGILTAAILVTGMSGYMPAWAAQKTSTTKTKEPLNTMLDLCGVTDATVVGTTHTTIITWNNGKVTVSVVVHAKVLDGDVKVGTISSSLTQTFEPNTLPTTFTFIVNITCKGSGHQSSDSFTFVVVVDENGETRVAIV